MEPRKREVKDRSEVQGILVRCSTVRIGMFDGQRPYVVPVSFGIGVRDGPPVIYFHCDKRGLKADVCLGLPITNVFKVEVESITGKRTLPELWKQAGGGTPCFDE